MEKRKPEKHVHFFKLVDSFSAAGCPFCFYVQNRMQRYFETLLYEGVNDRAFRRKFNAAGGFCKHHVEQLGSYNDGLAVAILYQPILEKTVRKAVPRPRDVAGGSRASRTSRGRKAAECPACEAEAASRDDYVSVFSHFVEDDELAAAYGSSPGFCLPHYRQITAPLAAVPEWLENGQTRALSQLADGVDRLIEFSNFTGDAARNLSREDQLVWKRLIRRIYGEPE